MLHNHTTYLDLRVVGNRWLAVHGGNDNLKDAKRIFLHGMGLATPVI
jgi:hypothetical protein